MGQLVYKVKIVGIDTTVLKFREPSLRLESEVGISAGQLSQILTHGNHEFHQEKDAVLSVGIIENWLFRETQLFPSLAPEIFHALLRHRSK